eukprot:SAG11_NODE_21983_length_414_cov_1.453968_1_plen_102_part_00
MQPNTCVVCTAVLTPGCWIGQSTAFSFGAFVVGVWGMNLQWEGGPMDPEMATAASWFSGVVIATLAFQLLGVLGFARWLFEKFPVRFLSFNLDEMLIFFRK